MTKNISLPLLFCVLCLFSCRSTKQTTESPKMNTTRILTQGAKTIVYKTIRDFNDNVPITMNAERTKIVSFPSPTDLKFRGELAKPTQLKNGYLLDNRGISVHTVFTSYTYEEYSELNEVPTIAVWREKIIEMYPLVEMYNCGLRSELKNEVEELNALIEKDFEGCEKLVKINLPVLQIQE